MIHNHDHHEKISQHDVSEYHSDTEEHHNHEAGLYNDHFPASVHTVTTSACKIKKLINLHLSAESKRQSFSLLPSFGFITHESKVYKSNLMRHFDTTLSHHPNNIILHIKSIVILA